VRITSTDLGFILGPRLNAAGRLDDLSLGIECLLCDDEALARDMAVQLDQLNQDRKAIEQGMQREARIPITPWCQSASNRHKPNGSCSRLSSLSCASASRCIP
ncbi:hypothetical protein ACV34M_31230, partial [Pseudomonas aeruginosa]